VLLKFKLLELQIAEWEDFMKWALTTSYLTHIRKKFFNGIPASDWITELCDELIKSGVAWREGTEIRNA
jgi:hypothetical protein